MDSGRLRPTDNKKENDAVWNSDVEVEEWALNEDVSGGETTDDDHPKIIKKRHIKKPKLKMDEMTYTVESVLTEFDDTTEFGKVSLTPTL